MGDGGGVCAVGLVVLRSLSVFCAVVVGCLPIYKKLNCFIIF